jgi:ComF family protein
LLVPRLRFIFSESMKDLHLDGSGPPGQHGGATGWRAITHVLRSNHAIRVAMHSAVADLTNTLLPSDCRTCGSPMIAFGKVRVCEECIARVGSRANATENILCARCGDALGMESARFNASLGIDECTLCRMTPPEFSRAVAFADYDHEMREMLHLLKFEHRRHIAEHVLGRRVADAILKLRPQTSADLVVIPVPLFAARERQRGFNQATLLAQAAVKRLRASEPAWRLHIHTRALSRIKDTHALYQLNPSQRRHNLRGAFRVLDPAALRGREILLIDDIMTTGATARECSRVLLAAGAAKVWVATAARAQPESPQTVVRHEAPDIAQWDASPQRKPRTIEPDVGKQVTF